MASIKAFIRHLIKNKLYTVVTIVGFAISLTFVLLLSVYINNELSVNNFQENIDRIYRIENEEPDFSGPIAVDLKNAYPEIEDYVRVYENDGVITTNDDQKFKLSHLAVDDSFFNIFSYPLIEGDSSEVLRRKNSIVLSQTYARKLFGGLDPIGKKITLNTRVEFIVTGIMEDFPENTHFKPFDAITNIRTMADITNWDAFLTERGFCSMDIYFLEKKNADLVSKTPEILENFKKDFWLYKEGYANILEFTSLKEIYFGTKNGNGTKSNSKTLIVILSVIVLLILFLAIGNYVNLTIAQSTFRGKEVAIKKLMGSSKKRLFFQFIKESVLLCLIAVLFALFLTKLAEPGFNYLLNTQLNLNDKITFKNIFVLIGTFSGLGIVSGLLPALKITSFKPIEIVKGDLRRKSKGIYGKVFITFQYTVTIALLVCSWMILKQTNFLKNHDLGFQKDHIVNLEYVAGTDKRSTIKDVLEKVPNVEAVSITWQSPLSGGSNQSFDYNGKPLSFQEFRVDTTFFNIFEITIDPTKIAYTKEGVYLNQIAVLALGHTKDNIPASFVMNGVKLPILGIVNDFNFNNLQKGIGPLMIRQLNENSYPDNIFVKIKAANKSETLKAIQNAYKGLVGNAPFELRFVDDTINQWYIKEEKTGKVIGYFTLLSFIISFMGILAIATFYIQQRKKEVGIRKVNGATITQILALLNKDFIKWVGLAFIIAVPISWFIMGKWLESFAYKTTMSWWVFALAGLTAFLISILTVSWQSFRAATTNPVEALRNE